MRSVIFELPSLAVYCEELDHSAELFFNYEVGEWRIDFGIDLGGELPKLMRSVTDYDWVVVGHVETPNPELRL